MAKFLRVVAIIFLSLAVVAAALYFSFLIITRNAVLDESKLLAADKMITVYDGDGNEITDASLTDGRKSVKIENLDPKTVQAFIASEDRTFYSHRGLNYKRMIKAAYTNLTSRSFKEGASTISQQLIKNTHLSGEKTISRKLNEIRLTKKLEKRYSKDEILGMYLNTIYFGHNCYGLQSAADFYFGKKAEDLTLGESATLVGLLSSPNNYSPLKNPEKSLLRRNMVLKAMRECGYIDGSEYEKEKAKPIETAERKSSASCSDYLGAVFDEFEACGADFYNSGMNYKIYTRLDPDLQKAIENYQYPCDSAVIVTSADGQVIAYRSAIGNTKRQPASAIKPLAVYAPAMEEKIVSPFTRILDEKIDYNGYSPENNDGKFHGYVTVAESIEKSYNVPAVKTLNSLTVEKAKKYLNRSGIYLENGDENLSLALGGMKTGVTIKQLADAYSQFAAGNYRPSAFIQKITDKDGKTVYENNAAGQKIYSDGVCSLMNEMLIGTSKTGTAAKLKNLNYDVASKTGTCGDGDGNTDAYSINYTSEHCVAVWLGDKERKKLSITGGNTAVPIAKFILGQLYGDSPPKPLEKEAGTETAEIDAGEYYKNNKIMLCDDTCPVLNRLKVKAVCGNLPTEKSTRFTTPVIKNPAMTVENNCVKIELCQTKYYSYLIKRRKNGQIETIYDGKWQQLITDSPSDGVYVYSVVPYFKSGKTINYGEEIILPNVNICSDNKSPQIKVPGIANGEWYYG